MAGSPYWTGENCLGVLPVTERRFRNTEPHLQVQYPPYVRYWCVLSFLT